MKRLAIAGVGLALVVLASACADRGNEGEVRPTRSATVGLVQTPIAAPTQEPIPAGWTSHSGEGWSIGLPASWEKYPLEKLSSQPLGEADLLLVAMDSLNPSLSLVIGKVPGGKPRVRVKDGLDEMVEIDRQAGIAVISRNDRATAGPYDAGILQVHAPASEAYQLKYLVRVPDVAWFWIVFTFSFPEEEFDRVLFQQIIDSFRAIRY